MHQFISTFYAVRAIAKVDSGRKRTKSRAALGVLSLLALVSTAKAQQKASAASTSAMIQSQPTLATPLITDIAGRTENSVSLNGRWHYIVDPYETGFFDYRYKELKEDNPAAYWNDPAPKSKTDLVEFGWSDKYSLMVPGDWNHQKDQFAFFEATLWYQKSFDFTRKLKKGASKLFLYFGAVNYRADVYLNGHKLGFHEGGFTPFNFEVPDSVIKAHDNNLVVRVNNTRHKDDVPTLNTDWWNYGGITRSVDLVELPATFIQDYSLQLTAPVTKDAVITGYVQLNQFSSQSSAGAAQTPKNLKVQIPELGFSKVFPVTGERTAISFTLPRLELWSPDHPKLYTVTLSTDKDKLSDKIGFRTVKASGKQVLLNGKPIFMRGIAIHEEIPSEVRRAWSKADALQLLGQAKELGCNMVRLAHYPHDESMTRAADSLGFLVWSEIPVYWTIDFTSKQVYAKAARQLREMITRDHNRASIIVWSVGNETPVSPARTDFMHQLIDQAHQLDRTRMVSAALEVNYNSGKNVNEIDDPLGAYVDLVAFNEYLGWYGGTPDKCRTTNWATPYNKPLFISETGGGAKYGFHADSLTRFSEAYQVWYYKELVSMLGRMPDNWVGMSPWVLADFRSPKRNNPVYQEGWNRKGLYSDKGEKKAAFYILQGYYNKIKNEGHGWPAKTSH
ncbi:beta-glucuronidase [Arachidicoccus rhizosphaerae]|uniref:Beta-glucuronidase n=1 Tax=Arachidicoccus rhizosphaerae TaxID=551991 RepID=A0A1H3Z966_9BACT|nr:glycoside hydrolase family 2 TIM barrel-domain containing protein [Arachidicoccus rhizosphaerae]SEA20323.1 beta-glucuronidase [Arachidicoccus rhizosphaerae]